MLREELTKNNGRNRLNVGGFEGRRCQGSIRSAQLDVDLQGNVGQVRVGTLSQLRQLETLRSDTSSRIAAAVD